MIKKTIFCLDTTKKSSTDFNYNISKNTQRVVALKEENLKAKALLEQAPSEQHTNNIPLREQTAHEALNKSNIIEAKRIQEEIGRLLVEYNDLNQDKTYKSMQFLKDFKTYMGLAQVIVICVTSFAIASKISHLTDFSSFFSNIKDIKDTFFTIDLTGYDTPILDEANLGIDDQKEEEKEEIVLIPDDKSNLNLKTQSESNLYFALKVTGFVIGSVALLIGIVYCVAKFGSQVDAISDVAQKGLDDSAKIVEEATQRSLSPLDEKEKLLKAQQTKLIKELTIEKPRSFYTPPKRK